MDSKLLRFLVIAVAQCFYASVVSAAPLKAATWNLAWLANEPITKLELVNACEQQERDKVEMDKREPAACRKGSPFRMAGAYALLSNQAKQFDFDIIGLQEIQGLAAAQLIFGDRILPSGDTTSKVSSGTYRVVVNTEGGWQKVGLAVKAALLTPGQELVAKPFTEIGVPVKRDKRSALDVMIPLKTGTLRVLVVHLKSACHRIPLDSSTEDCQQLAAQAPILNAWIKQRQNEGKPFMILGDFNRVLASTAQHEQCNPGSVCSKVSLRASLDGNAMDQPPILLPTADAQHVPECGFRGDVSMIDQILLGGGMEAWYVPGSVRSHPYLGKDGKPVAKNLVRYLSDHCAVSVEFDPLR